MLSRVVLLQRPTEVKQEIATTSYCLLHKCDGGIKLTDFGPARLPLDHFFELHGCY